jgi:hypothetical protein
LYGIGVVLEVKKGFLCMHDAAGSWNGTVLTWKCVTMREFDTDILRHFKYLGRLMGENIRQTCVGCKWNDLNAVRLEVFPAASMKIGIFWDAALCSLVDIVIHHPDDGDSKLL